MDKAKTLTIICAVGSLFVSNTTSFVSQRQSTFANKLPSTASTQQKDRFKSLSLGFPRHEQLHEQCHKIRNREVKKACIQIAKNPILASMGKRAKGNIGAGEIPVIRGRGITFRFFESLTQNTCKKDSEECPINGETISSDKLWSVSPWKQCEQYDPLRYPQRLPVAECLCNGCVFPDGRRTLNLFSKEIYTTISVLRKTSIKHSFQNCNPKICEVTTQKIAIGCHCQYATDMRLT